MNDAVNYVDLFGLTSNDICYTVQPGDCVWKIADKYDCTTQQVIDNNNFSNPNLIHPGDKIYIPVAKPAAANDTGSAIAVATPSNNGSVSTNASRSSQHSSGSFANQSISTPSINIDVDIDFGQLLNGFQDIVIGSGKSYIGLSGTTTFGSLSAVLLADDVTGAGVIDDGIAVVTGGLTVASGVLALDGAKQAAEGFYEIASSIHLAFSKSSNVPVPETTNASNGLKYRSNPKHTLGGSGNNKNAGIEPRNSLDLFEQSVEVKGNKARWTYDKVSDTVHRFSPTGDGSYHWSGSTNQGANSLTTEITKEVKQALGIKTGRIFR